MNNSLVLYQKTEIAENSFSEDLLSLYGIPNFIDKIATHEKAVFLDNFVLGGLELGAAGSELSNIFNSKELVIEIPGVMKDLLKSGEAYLEKSKIIEGNFTPNIKIKGKNGIAGQITLKENYNGESVANSLSNLAMLAMIQTILAKLDGIEESIEDVKIGQMNDRIAEVVAPFKTFCDLYPTFTSTEELNREINITYGRMQEGLLKLHLQIEEERKKLEDAPDNLLSDFKFAVKKLFVPRAIDKLRTIYRNYIKHVNLYYRLLLLSDMVVSLKGGHHSVNILLKNHNIISRYLNEFHGDIFIKKMEYLVNRKPNEILYLQHLNESLDFEKIGFSEMPLLIETSQSN